MTGMLNLLRTRATATQSRKPAPAAIEPELRRALAIALRIAPNRAAAEDAVQQAFLATWSRKHELRDPSAFWPYLITSMLRNLWAESRGRSRFVPEGEHIEQRSSQQLSTEQKLAQAQRREKLHAAIAKLPQRRREVIELRLAGMSGQEVATALGISHTTARVTYHQALCELRQGFQRSTA